jgi:hypothetical protein
MPDVALLMGWLREELKLLLAAPAAVVEPAQPGRRAAPV